MAHERIKPEFLFDEKKVNLLKQIAPECFEDGKLNFETLRQNLGDWAQDEEDGDLEHFGLFWPGKKDARRLATIPPEGTLEPVYGEGLKTDGTPDDDGVNDSKNIFIEGENLEVLKILQKSYSNKIKMIYIDPPYNTGNDFVYDDDYTEPLQEYLRRTGQIDEEGKPLTTNKKSDGRFHSKWLSMMYPRLRLARNLLKEDGVIFVSIDDNEIHNLKALMNEVFGEENFLSQFIWNSEGNTDNQLEVKVNHEYILCYLKDLSNKTEAIGRVIDPNTPADSNLRKGYADNNINKNSPANPPAVVTLPIGFPCTEKEYIYKGKNLDDEFFSISKREKYISDSLKEKYQIENNSGLPVKIDNMVVKDFKLFQECRIYGGYANGAKLQQFIDNNCVPIIDDDNSPISFYLNRNAAVRYRKDVKKPRNILSVLRNLGTTEKSKTELKRMGVYFSYPKPVGLIEYLVEIGADEQNSIVLDFFAGSGSTAHSVLSLNDKMDQKRRFITIQYPELCDEKSDAFKNGYSKISDISIDRIKKVSKATKINSGINVLKLANSNFKKWSDIHGKDISQLEMELEKHNNSPLRDDWNNNKLLKELMLLEGFPLDATKAKSTLGSNRIVKVESEMIQNTLLICLDDKIEEGLIEELKLDSDSTFICLDSAISNQNKLRLSDKGLIKTI